MDEQQLLQVMKELIAAQLVVEESADQFAFRHALTREAVYNTLLLRERKNHHRTIAETLERLYADSRDMYLADLAFHFYKAEVWSKALEYSQSAGEKAQALYAPREAIEHFTRALQAAQHLTSQSPRKNEMRLHRARGQAFEILGEFERARIDYEAALEMARAEADRHGEWQALLDLGFLWASGDYAKTGEYFRQALDHARTLGDPATLGHTLNRVGNWYTNIEQPREALTLHQEALDIFQELNDHAGLAETYDLLGLTNILAGNWAQGGACYEQAIARFRELDDRQGLVSALATYAERGIMFFDGPSYALRISFSAVTQEAEEAVKLARAIGWRSGEAYALVVLSGLCASFGEMGRALELGHSALQIAQEIEHRQWITLAQQVLGGVYLALLELNKSKEYLEQAVALAHQTESLLFSRQCAAWLAGTFIVQGDSQSLKRADEVLRAALDSDGQWHTFGRRLCGYARVELALARGEAEQAWQILNELQPDAMTIIGEAVTPRLWKLRGQALMQLDRLAEAETALQMALHAIPRVGNPPLLWQIHVALGQVCRLQWRRDQAEAEFATARQVIEQQAANIRDEDLKSKFLDRALAKIPALRPSSPLRAAKMEYGGLTARERKSRL